VAHNAGQVPIYYNHPHGSSWHQGESIGFADYVDAPHTPRYAFGHGLSYTQFEYADLSLSGDTVQATDELDISVRITNVGERSGTEVVQLYLADRYATVSRPVLELAGFRRVTLQPGTSARVSFRLSATQLAFLDAEMNWRVEAGDVNIMVGASSQDLRLQGTVTVASDAIVDGSVRGFFAS